METDSQTISNHLQIISLNAPESGYLELRAFSDKGRDGGAASFWLPVKYSTEDIKLAVEWAGLQSESGRGVFIGYNARKTRQGTKAAVQEMTAAYVDLDLEKHGISREEASGYEMLAPRQADSIIESGHGLHLIYFFQPITDKQAWESLQTALANYYASVGADNSLRTDEARVLRLAGTPNQKGDEPKQTSIVDYRPLETPRTFAEIAAAFNASVVSTERLVIDAEQSKLVEQITESGTAGEYGGRNDFLFRRGCALRDDGHSRAEIQAVLEVMNEHRCSPPLDQREVNAIVEQVVKYEPTHSLQPLLDEEVIELGTTQGELKSKIFPPYEAVVFGLVAGQMGVVVAKPNLGKTTLLLNMALSAACGRGFAPLITEGAPKKVLYADFENPQCFCSRTPFGWKKPTSTVLSRLR
jgi:hypothetical protein